MSIKIIQTIKLIVVSIVAIVVAEYFNLNFSVSAGIVVILSIGHTKIETIKTALQRLYAFIVALIIAYGCFYVFDFTLMAFFMYLILYISFCKYKKYESAIAMNSVLISHFLTIGSMNFNAIYNEVLIFSIGVSLGIISNLHLRKDHYYIKQLKGLTDDKIKVVLSRMAKKINGETIDGYDGECIEELISLINEVKSIVRLNYMNQFNQNDTFDLDYVSMRYDQILVLNQMYLHTYDLQNMHLSAKYISTCLEDISNQFHEENEVDDLLVQIEQLYDLMKRLELPNSREEFEERAKLFILIQDMKQFVLLKYNFINEQKGKV